MNINPEDRAVRPDDLTDTLLSDDATYDAHVAVL